MSWSLSDKVFFYALFPFSHPVAAQLALRERLVLLAVLLTVGEVVPMLVQDIWIVFINPPFRLTEFLIGVCLAALVIDGVRPRVPVGFATALALAACLAAGWVPDRRMLSAITLMPFALLILAAAEEDLAGRPARVLHTAALVRLGQWLFSFSLAHALVVSAFVRVAEAASMAVRRASACSPPRMPPRSRRHTALQARGAPA